MPSGSPSRAGSSILGVSTSSARGPSVKVIDQAFKIKNPFSGQHHGIDVPVITGDRIKKIHPFRYGYFPVGKLAETGAVFDRSQGNGNDGGFGLVQIGFGFQFVFKADFRIKTGSHFHEKQWKCHMAGAAGTDGISQGQTVSAAPGVMGRNFKSFGVGGVIA